MSEYMYLYIVYFILSSTVRQSHDSMDIKWRNDLNNRKFSHAFVGEKRIRRTFVSYLGCLRRLSTGSARRRLIRQRVFDSSSSIHHRHEGPCCPTDRILRRDAHCSTRLLLPFNPSHLLFSPLTTSLRLAMTRFITSWSAARVFRSSCFFFFFLPARFFFFFISLDSPQLGLVLSISTSVMVEYI